MNVASEVLQEKLKEALDGLYVESGIWTLPALSSTVLVASGEDKHGRDIQIQIIVTAEEDDFIN